MDRDRLVAVEEVKSIKGIDYPADVGFRSLLITGPPGAGKTTRVETLGGWPGEVFLDLTRRNWWRDRTLTMRPREVHLGLPFVGHAEGLALFEEPQRETDHFVFEAQRLQLPPPRRRFNPVDWRRKFVLEFLLPPAEEVLAVREKRAVAQTHTVDEALFLEQIRHQLEVYFKVAGLLDHAGLRVLVRTGFNAPPRVFRDDSAPGTMAFPADRVGGRRLFERAVGRLLGSRPDTAIQHLDSLRLNGEGITMSPAVLPVELRQGGLRLQVHRDRTILPVLDEIDTLVIVNSAEVGKGIHGQARVPRGARFRMTYGTGSRKTSLPMSAAERPRVEVANTKDGVMVTDLHSERGTQVVALEGGAAGLLEDQIEANLERVWEALGRSLEPAAPGDVRRRLGRVNESLARGHGRVRATDGEPGAIVELPPEIVPVIVGDLHANIDNLLKILCSNGFLESVQAGSAALIFLGDAVHSEKTSRLAEMDSSLLIMDLILRLMEACPDRVLYLRGNHDTFSSQLTKEGVPQGSLWRKRMEEVWGLETRREFEHFYSLCPVLAASHDFVACHAGPPQGSVSRHKLINLREHPDLEHQLTWGRVRGPGRPAGYAKSDVRALMSALGLAKKATMIVSHNPTRDGESVWLRAGGIKRHHVVYSAGDRELAVFTRLGRWLRPLVYRSEPLLEALRSAPSGLP